MKVPKEPLLPWKCHGGQTMRILTETKYGQYGFFLKGSGDATNLYFFLHKHPANDNSNWNVQGTRYWKINTTMSRTLAKRYLDYLGEKLGYIIVKSNKVNELND